MRWVYVIESEAGEHYYVGMTNDYVARLAKHNAGAVRHTAKYRPWRLKNLIGFSNDERAVAFESYLKSSSGRAFARKRL